MFILLRGFLNKTHLRFGNFSREHCELKLYNEITSGFIEVFNPDLLDWLAVELHDSGWDLKHMLRLMVTSRTFCQSSAGQHDFCKYFTGEGAFIGYY